ncbi:MAG: hypothetical protein LQ341_001882 [Variospora aurantia]|nr:MAG: hypothetical protein LQ341_001882 [Variospora aurantia]
MKLSPLILIPILFPFLSASAADWSCYPFKAQSGTCIACASAADCARAIRKLPSSIARGDFYNGGRAGEFQLPQTVSAGTCEVIVDTKGSYSGVVPGSWLDIASLANLLMVNCGMTDGWRQPPRWFPRPFGFEWMTGGSVAYGNREGFKITMRKTNARIEEPAPAAVEGGEAPEEGPGAATA